MSSFLLFSFLFFFFFFNVPATTEIYTLSLHDALPIFPAFIAKLEHVPVSSGQCRKKIRQPPGIYMPPGRILDRKSTRLNSSHTVISYAVFCLKKKKNKKTKKKQLTQLRHNNISYIQRK